MYAFFDHYTFSDNQELLHYLEIFVNSNLCTTISFETASVMDEVVDTLCEHFKHKNILILSEDEFMTDRPRCLTRSINPDNTIEVIRESGYYYPGYLLIITRNIGSVFANFAITSYAKFYHIPTINVIVDPVNYDKVMYY